MAFSLNLGNLEVHLLANNKLLARGLKKAEAMMDRTSKKMRSIGRTMSLYVTAPLALIGGASVKAFASFDDAMTQSLAIMGDVSAEMREEMEETAKTISSKSITSATQLAESYFFLASAGLTAEQSVVSLATVEKFAVAGRFDMALATDLLTDAQTALGLSSKDTATNLKNLIRISDVLVGANVLANTSVQQVAEALTSDAATAARGFGAELETVVAVLDAYGSAGKKAGQAGNLFGRATRLLTKAQRENSEEFERLGIRVINEATGEYNNFITIMNDMEDAFKDMTRPQRDAALETLGFAALAQKAITPLLGLGDAMKTYEERLLNMAGITKEVADKQLKSFLSQLKILLNNVKLVGIEIGLVLAPYILLLGGYVQKAITWFRALDASTKQWIVTIGVVVAAIGPLLIGLGLMIALIKFVLVAAVTWVPIVFLAIAIAAAVWVVVDALTDADLKILEWVEDFRLGGAKIETWMTALGTVLWQTWEWSINKSILIWESLVLGVKEVGTMIWVGMLQVAKGINSAFWSMAIGISDAMQWLTKKITEAMNFWGLLSDETTRGILNNIDALSNSMRNKQKADAKFYQDQIDSSLSKSEDRWVEYYSKITDLDRKNAESAAKWEKVRNDAFAKDFIEGADDKESSFTDKINNELDRIKKILNMGDDLFGATGSAKPGASGTSSVSTGSFKEMSLRRFLIDPVSTNKKSKQEVHDSVVANKLDELIAETKRIEGGGVILG